MITRAAALAHSPRVWVLVGPTLALAVATAAWHVWDHREQLIDRAVRLVSFDSD